MSKRNIILSYPVRTTIGAESLPATDVLCA